MDQNSVWIKDCDANFYLSPLAVAQTFYGLVRKIVNSIDKTKFVALQHSAHTFDSRDKISNLQLLWCGHDDKDIVVHVDLAPAFQIDGKVLIAKTSRHLNDIKYDEYTGKVVNTSWFHLSDAEQQRAKLLQLPLNVRQGMLIAKGSVYLPSIRIFQHGTWYEKRF